MIHTFRQSQLNTLLTCLEQGRLDMIDHVEQETDATAIGTAVHSGAEFILNGSMDIEEATRVAIAKFDELSALPHFQWLQVKRRDTVVRYIQLAMKGWWEQVYPRLGNPMMVEETFRLPLAARSNGDELWLTGTIDFVDEVEIYDWKTAGDEKKYKDGYGGDGWKLKRFAVQPTVYTWAVHELTGKNLPFTFVAVTKGTDKFQYVTCERGPADWAWLTEQLWGLVDFMGKQGLEEPWPKNDQHALCSEKWCPRWATCKGQHYAAG